MDPNDYFFPAEPLGYMREDGEELIVDTDPVEDAVLQHEVTRKVAAAIELLDAQRDVAIVKSIANAFPAEMSNALDLRQALQDRWERHNSAPLAEVPSRGAQRLTTRQMAANHLRTLDKEQEELKAALYRKRSAVRLMKTQLEVCMLQGKEGDEEARKKVEILLASFASC